MSYPFTEIKINGLVKKPDGTITIRSVELDPDKPEAEMLLYNNMMRENAAPPLSVPPTPQPAAIKKPAKTSSGMLLSDAMKKYVKEKSLLNPKSKHHYTTEVADDFRLIVRILGDNPINDLNRDAALDLFEKVKQLPANINKTARFKDSTIPEILAMDDVKPRAESTINGVMVNASALCGWLAEHEYVRQDYFKGLRVPRKKGGRDRLEDTDLEMIFGHITYTGLEYKYVFNGQVQNLL